MRKILLLSLLGLSMLSSCALSKRKHGCVSSIETHTRKVNGKIVTDSFLVKRYKDNTCSKLLLNYKEPYTHLYTGHGKVVVIDTTISPKSCLIRIDDVLIENDSTISSIKFIVVYEGKYFNQLKPHFNNGDVVYVEQKLCNIDYDEIGYSVTGRVDHVDTHDSTRKDVIFVDFKKQ